MKSIPPTFFTAALRAAWRPWAHSWRDADVRRCVWVVLVACLCLTLLDYLCDRAWVWRTLRDLGRPDWAVAFNDCCVRADAPLGRALYWALVNIGCYCVLPFLTIHYALRQPLQDFGVRRRGAMQGWPIYLLMALVMLPLVAYFSAQGAFLARYPFLQLPAGAPLWPTLLWWEVLYCAQFFALEFFFRGFLLHGLAPRMGIVAVLVMALPYCMLHFGKPLPETLASIAAALILGTLALQNRSIVPGALLHCAVAVSMDVAALWRKGWLPGL